MKALDDQTLRQALKNLPHWTFDEDALMTMMEFEDFSEAMRFVEEIAELVHQRNHHPTIVIENSQVTLELSTHDAGDCVTDLDVSFAHAIDNIYERFSRPPAHLE